MRQYHASDAIWERVLWSSFSQVLPSAKDHTEVIQLPCVCVYAKSPQLCPTLCDPVDLACQASLSVGILQAKILEWVAMPSCRGSSRPKSLMSLALADVFSTTSTTWKALSYPSEVENRYLFVIFLSSAF